MIRFDFDGRQWRRAILPAGVRAEDHDAADRVIRWEPCDPPPHARGGRPAGESPQELGLGLVWVIVALMLALVVIR